MISFVIPCYNVSSFIEETINSILNQNDDDWEIIAVNDGSKDNTLNILKRYESLDNRIHVISQTNSGVSSARNNGLLNANGELVYFLDGDDWINKNVVHSAKRISHSDIILMGYIREDNKRTKYIPRYSTNMLNDFLINKQHIHIGATIYRRKFLLDNNIKFDKDTSYSEDREFIAKCLYLASSYEIISDTLFHYRINSNSAMSKKVYNEIRYSSVLACERIYRLFENTLHEPYALIQLKTTIILHWKLISEFTLEDKQLINRLANISSIYLIKSSKILINRDSLFAFVLGHLYKIPKVFKTIIGKIL